MSIRAPSPAGDRGALEVDREPVPQAGGLRPRRDPTILVAALRGRLAGGSGNTRRRPSTRRPPGAQDSGAEPARHPFEPSICEKGFGPSRCPKWRMPWPADRASCHRKAESAPQLWWRGIRRWVARPRPSF